MAKKEKKLVITEKRSVAETIAKALGKPKARKDYFEVGDYIITWAQGHLFTLAEPHMYSKGLKYWRLGQLPIVPQQFKLMPIQGPSKKRIEAIKKLLPKVDLVINAMDAGREGELIFRYIKRALGIKKPVKRLWLQAMTKDAILEAFQNLKDEDELENLGQAAEARSEADWLVGINSTRAITVLGRELFSIGRVQTPTLAILVDREKEIQQFKPTPYWKIRAELAADKGNFEAWWVKKGRRAEEAQRIWSRGELEEIWAKVKDAKAGKCIKVEHKKGTKTPPLPFKLSTFQRVASALWGWTAKRALGVLQELYERGLVTYPRTDSDHLPTAMKKEVGKIAKNLQVLYPQLDTSRIKASSRPSLFDDSKVSDHYAVIPTGKLPPDDLKPDLKKAYDLVARRFFAAFYPKAEFINQTAILDIAGEDFIHKGTILTNPGYLAIYPEDGRNLLKTDATPPILSKDTYPIQKMETKELTTKPPARYTDGTLIKVMETAGREIEDEKLKEVLKGKGIGTPATRAQIIETLIQRGYVKREGKALVPTKKGIELIDLLRKIGLKELTEPTLTGEWEYRLKLIEEGKKPKEEFMGEVTGLTTNIVETIRSRIPELKQQLREATDRGKVIGKCPKCGGNVLVGPKAYYCENVAKGTCDFVIYRNTYGGTITPEMAQELLQQGHTSKPVRLYSRGKKKYYRAKLVLTEDGKVVPEFMVKKG